MVTDQDIADRITRGPSLIIWNEESEKWQDPSNDYWCHRSRQNPDMWTVVARYWLDRDSGITELDFPTEQQAMAFYVNFLHQKRIRA